MNKYKISDYTVSQQLSPEIFLCSNFKNGRHILLKSDIYSLLSNGKIENLKQMYPAAFERLVDNSYILQESTNEFGEFLMDMKNGISDTNSYHIIINPTLDCNLNCWYCYENKVSGSRMQPDVISAIYKHLDNKFKETPFKLLKLSFFGGEPFLHQDIVVRIIDIAREICNKNHVQLTLDFTTNGTVLSERLLQNIQKEYCDFQITLDGDRQQHNRIKFSKNLPDAYSATVTNIQRIQQRVEHSFIYVRINFDRKTLSKIDNILADLAGLERNKTKIILKKIWQVDSKEISKEEVLEIIDKILEKGFDLDYYSQGGICFADRQNQVTINYDGSIHKCTTIKSFAQEHSLGQLDEVSGEIKWREEKIRYLSNTGTPQDCMKCPILPSCGGPCRKKLSGWTSTDCFLNELGLTAEEYALIQFKVQMSKTKRYV